MKSSQAWLVSALVVVSGAAFAQAGGGNGNGGNGGSGGSGNAHGAATAAPTTNGQPTSGAMSSSGSKSHHMSKAKKPKTKCCVSDTRCKRCPIRMLKEGTLPQGYTVKKRRLVKAA